jgi:hypothetical protein
VKILGNYWGNMGKYWENDELKWVLNEFLFIGFWISKPKNELERGDATSDLIQLQHTIGEWVYGSR